MSNPQLLTFEDPARLFNASVPVIIRWNPPSFTGLLGDTPYMNIWLFRHDYTTDIDQTTNPGYHIAQNYSVAEHEVLWIPTEQDVDYNVTNAGTHQLAWERTVDNPDMDPANRHIKYNSPGFHVINPTLYYGLSTSPPTTPPTPLPVTSQASSSTTSPTSLPTTSQAESSTTSSTSSTTTPPTSSSTTSSASSLTTSLTSSTTSLTSTSTMLPLSLATAMSPAASPSTSTDPSNSQSPGVDKSSSPGLAQPTVVGLGVGLAILFLTLVCAVLWFLLRRRRSAQGKDFTPIGEPIMTKAPDKFYAWPPPRELETHGRPRELDALKPPQELPGEERGHRHT